jgi:hypothetical protein
MGSIITASLGRQLKKDFMSFHPGMEMKCEISYMKGTKRTFYDIDKVIEKKTADISQYGLPSFDKLCSLPADSKNVPQYDILIPLTKDYTDISTPRLTKALEKDEIGNGFWIHVEKKSNTDDMYGFKRNITITYSQWIESKAQDAVQKKFHINIGTNALGCFGITNLKHWEDNEYANMWLFQSEYVLRAYLSKKTKETLSKIDSGFPEKIYLLVTDVLTDLSSQVKKLGMKCDASQVKDLVERLPDETERASFSKENRYSKDPESKILNVGETTNHEIDMEKWEYYVVSLEKESMPQTDSVFDLFAIKK